MVAHPDDRGCARRRFAGTVLLVEDEAPLRKLVAMILRRLGHTVLEAASGIEALALCERHDGSIDLVVSDVVMPGMKGPSVVRELAKVYPGARVLFMSAYPSQTVLAEVAASGARLLEKPFTPEEFERELVEVLEAGAPLGGAGPRAGRG